MGEVIKIDPITRLEGHGRIDIFLDEVGEVGHVTFQVPELRGFEKFCVGRRVEEMPGITSRLCGVCPAAHHLASAKAVDAVYGVVPPPTARKLRELMYMAHYCHSHIAHFYALSAPDFVCGPDADPAERNIIGVVARVGEAVGLKVVEQRSRAQKAQVLLAGRATHMLWCLPGGVSKGLSSPDRDTLETWGDDLLEFARFSVKLFKDVVLANAGYVEMILSDPYALKVHDMGLVDDNGLVNFYDGQVRVTGPDGTQTDRYDPADYLSHIAERVEPFTYLKFPYLKNRGWKGFVEGADSGVYRASPLSRMNASKGFATPEAQAAREEFYKTLGGGAVHATLATHWARLIELVYAAERWCQLVRDPEIVGDVIRTVPDRTPSEGVGCVEAPRGTLTHHYRTDSKGILTGVNLIVGTTNNNAPISMSVAKAARGLIRRGVQVTEGILNRIEMAFRAYDPCMSCATHSVPGSMPLTVVVREADGTPLQEVTR